MKAFKTDANIGAGDVAIIGRGVEVSGQVLFRERLDVDGRITGKVTSEKGILVVGEAGLIEAEIEVGQCIVYGRIEGDVTASTRVELRKTGKLHGDLVTPSLLVEEGATMNGLVKMDFDKAGSRNEARMDSKVDIKVAPEPVDQDRERKGKLKVGIS